MNEAATATAIFPFIGMNRSTNPINLDHPPTPSTSHHQHPAEKPATDVTAGPAGHRHQPHQPTGHQPDNRRAGTDEPIPGPFRTSHHPTPPPRPLIPRGRTREATTAAEGRSSRHRPTAASPTDSRPTTSAASRQAATPRRGTSFRATRSTPESPRSSASTPRGKPRARPRTIPNRGTNKGSQDPRTATEHCRADRKIPVRTGLRTVHPEAADAHACGEAGLIRSLVLVVLGPSPRAPEREHNEEVDRHADAGSGDQHETPSNTPATGDTPIRHSTPREA